MIKKIMSEMTLREKIGQTAMPDFKMVSEGIKKYGSLGAYFKEYPFAGFYVYPSNLIDKDGNRYTHPHQSAQAIKDAADMIKIPLLVSCDCERGAKFLFDEFHNIASNMGLGAANSGELAYKRTYYWARELKSCGVNWPFGPVFDLMTNFFCASGVRVMSDQPDIICHLAPYIIKGVHDAGLASCSKHFPGNASSEYRDSHVSNTSNSATLDQWRERCKPIWQAAIDSGTDAFMVGHVTFPAAEGQSESRIPSSASKNVLNLLREELGFDGVAVTDDCGMKSLSATFGNRGNVYVECFNAGNDIVLFCRNDYIDVMEQAVKDGRVSEADIDKSVERVLKLKEKLGLFKGVEIAPTLTEEEKADFDLVNYKIAEKGLTLITNSDNIIPFDAAKAKNAAIITISTDPRFSNSLEAMVDAFGENGISAKIYDGLKSQEELEEISAENDIIVYACFLKAGFKGLQFFSRPEDFDTLFNSMSTGAEKSVIASFSSASIYYNYFEGTPTYINAYSNSVGTMHAFVDGILGKFEFTGKSPVALKPEFK